MTSGEYRMIKKFDPKTMSVKETLVRVGDAEDVPDPAPASTPEPEAEDAPTPKKKRRLRRKKKPAQAEET